MRLIASVFIVGAFLFVNLTVAHNTAQPATQPEPKSVTVPITLDHNRVIIDVYVPLSDGSTKRVRGWIDPGAPTLWVSPRVGQLMKLTMVCNGQICSAGPALPPNHALQIAIGGMTIPLSFDPDIKVPGGVRPPGTDDVMIPGTSAEIKIPSTTLRNYDVLINFPDREFSIGVPGTLKFMGSKSKMLVDTNTGLIQIPSKVENKNYNFGLDLGCSISFLSQNLFDKLSSAHPDWPQMTGAVGPANVGGMFDDEAKWKLMRVGRLQYGPLYLTDVPVARTPEKYAPCLAEQAGFSPDGTIGANALMNYRIGLDYAHKSAYFEIGSTFRFPDFDVVGVIVRPKEDGRFVIAGVADFEGQPSVPDVIPGEQLLAIDGIPVPGSTLGQVWSALEGSPGQERKLTIENGGKQFVVAAKVRHFLGDAEEGAPAKKSGRKN
jgi:hypothetical protein